MFSAGALLQICTTSGGSRKKIQVPPYHLYTLITGMKRPDDFSLANSH